MFHHKHLDVHQREREGIVILDLKGKLVLGGGDIALRDFVQGLLDGGSRKLALDLAQVSEIDTAGNGVLLFISAEYGKAGGKLVLFNIAHSHGKLYEMARLETVIEIYRDELDAINSFFPDRATAHYDILEYVESQPPHEDKNHKT
ncbi:MAG TPA: STAS domain-containing protein [Bryobacteraceae bacterium]|jgi:anti-sigma B factor antagonist|nr:STAS domain-containing protein [Bryobacteraceae bacterium]